MKERAKRGVKKSLRSYQEKSLKREFLKLLEWSMKQTNFAHLWEGRSITMFLRSRHKLVQMERRKQLWCVKHFLTRIKSFSIISQLMILRINCTKWRKNGKSINMQSIQVLKRQTNYLEQMNLKETCLVLKSKIKILKLDLSTYSVIHLQICSKQRMMRHLF